MHKQQTQRRGTAMTETAVTLPLLAVLVLGSIEAANAVFIKQSLTIAAYEAGKLASRPGGTSTEAVNRSQQILDVRGLTGYSVTVSPTVTEALPSRAGNDDVSTDIERPSENILPSCRD